MAERECQLRILVIDDDDVLLSEASALAHPAVEFTLMSPAMASAAKGAFNDRHIIVVGVDSLGGLDLVSDLSNRPGMPPLIALGGRGAHGKSLEHVLLLAELRGAAVALPKPIDGIELALAAIQLIRARSGRADMANVAQDLERRLAW